MATNTLSYAAPAPSADPRRLFLYFGPLTLLVFLVAPENLLDIPTSYMLKDRLHSTAEQVSMFRLLTGIPMYACFVFGLVRDLWDPFGWRDRGYFRLFVPLTVAVFLWIALFPVSYQGLLVGMILAMVAFRFILAAYWGLLALIGQEALMSGRLSTLFNVFNNVPYIVASFAAGYMSDHLSPGQTFFLAAALTVPIGLFGFWKPRSVFNHVYDNPLARGTDFLGDVKRLVKHRAIYPALLINILWFFTPGLSTPLQFYLTDHLHTSDAAFAYFWGIFLASLIPTFLLYGFLCTRIAPSKLLWWSTIIGVPQMIPLAFIHSGNAALALAVPMGLAGGLASAAFTDLAIRSCPAGLQGTLMTLVVSVTGLAGRGSDLLGSKMYATSPSHGFLYCVIATTAVYGMILLVIPLIPKQVIATPDGEPGADGGEGAEGFGFVPALNDS